MPPCPTGEPGHGLHSGEPLITEDPRQLERPTEITPRRARFIGPLEHEDENPTLAGAGAEPIELAEDRPLHLRVACACDRQPQGDHGHRQVAADRAAIGGGHLRSLDLAIIGRLIGPRSALARKGGKRGKNPGRHRSGKQRSGTPGSSMARGRIDSHDRPRSRFRQGPVPRSRSPHDSMTRSG